MNNKILFALMFFLMSLMIFSQTRVAYVDSEIIINQLPEAQEVKNKLEAEQKLYLDTITVVENEIKSKAEALKAKYEDAQKQIEAGKITQDQAKALELELGKMQEEIQELDQKLTAYKQNVQQALLSLQAELFKPVREKITKAIEQLAKELKFNLVLDKASDALIYGDKEIDITFKVLDKLK
ncbi:MAG: OmpH family outer membrane protein [Ignavibacteria bacterium]|nr:OmpH family outer membrane protein [Ignavibacteria bacterium]